MRFYESIFILNPDLSSEAVESITKNMERIVAANGGNVLNIENWGKHKLAYHVKKHRYGTFVLFHLEGEPSVIGELERNFKFSENIIKYQTVRIGRESVGKTKISDEMVAEVATAVTEEEAAERPAAAEEKEEPERGAAAEMKEESSREEAETSDEDNAEEEAPTREE